ncbi:putative ABC transporter permease [Ructibacterium gallinarum]|nr:putative ABC transporter permease [Ructibacterium gallinarum]
MYSIIGWLYEVFLEVVVYRWGYSDRGILFGPYCPVYGFGALLFLFLVYPMIKRKKLQTRLLLLPVVFLLCALSATLLELITSYLCEAVLGSWPWQTYSQYAINFQARIALSPSIRFGIGGVVFLYLLQPLFEKLTTALPPKILTFLFGILSVLFVADLFSTIILHIFT